MGPVCSHGGALGEPVASRGISVGTKLGSGLGEHAKHGDVLHALGGGESAAGLLFAQ